MLHANNSLYIIKKEPPPSPTSKDSILFMQKKRKAQGEEDDIPSQKKKRVVVNDNNTTYYNDDEVVINSNRPCVNLVPIERLESNTIISSAFGINLFLEPTTVLRYCLYWISQYSNSVIKPEYWFNDIITNILTRPIAIELVSDIGFPAITDKLIRYRYLFSFIGSPLHSVPTVIFETQMNDAFFYALSYFEEEDNKCFQYANNGGLRGEVHLSLFNYNHILDLFFEPSFIIVTCFAVAVPYLLHGSIHNIIHPKDSKTLKKQAYIALKNEIYYHNTPIIDRMIESINFTEDDSIKCLNKANPFYESNLLRLKHDLTRLKKILELYVNDIDKVKMELLQFWSEKASFCSYLKKERLEFVKNKYCQKYDACM